MKGKKLKWFVVSPTIKILTIQTTGAIPANILYGPISRPRPSAKVRPNQSSFRGDIHKNVFKKQLRYRYEANMLLTNKYNSMQNCDINSWKQNNINLFYQYTTYDHRDWHHVSKLPIFHSHRGNQLWTSEDCRLVRQTCGFLWRSCHHLLITTPGNKEHCR